MKLYETYGPQDSLGLSTYGYWILPCGTILSLLEGMKHGAIVEDYVKNTPDQSSLETAIAYERAQDPEIKKSTLADLFACRNLGWVRIGISQYSDVFQISWSAKPTVAIKDSLRMILDEHDNLDEDLETDYGSVRGWPGLHKKLDNPIYWRQS